VRHAQLLAAKATGTGEESSTQLAEKKADRRAATAGPDAGAGEVTPVDIVKPV